MQPITYAISLELTEGSYILIAASFIIGVIITWALCAASKSANTSRYAAELEAEKIRTNEAKQRLASTQQDLQILRDSEAALKQEQASLIATFTAEKKAAKENELIIQDALVKLTDTFKTLSSDALISNQEQFLQLAKTSLSAQQQTALKDLDNRNIAVEQMIKPVAIVLDKMEQRISSLADSEQTKEAAYTSLTEQVQLMAETQKTLQKQTSQLINAFSQINQNQPGSLDFSEKYVSLTEEALDPLDPIDSFAGDENAHDFSTEELDQEFEGFTAETPGEGI